MDIDITKVTSKGQVVIPKEMRIEQDINRGDRLLVISSANKIIFEPINRLGKNAISEIEEDIIDKKIADVYFENSRKGKTIIQSKEEFLKEIEKW